VPYPDSRDESSSSIRYREGRATPVTQQRRARRLLGNSFSVATEYFAGLAVSLLVMPILLNDVGIEQYGIWVLVSAIVGYIALVQVDVMRGTSRFIAFHAARNELDTVRDIVAFSLSWFSVLAVLLTPAAWLVGTYLLPHLGVPANLSLLARNVFMLAFAHYCVGRILSPLRGLMAGLERFWVASAANVGGYLVYGALVIVLLAEGVGLYSLPIALITRSVFVAAVCYVAGRRLIGRVFGSPRLDKGVRGALLRFGGWHQVNYGARVVNQETDALLIGAWVNIDSVGHYGIASRLTEFVRVFPLSVLPPLLPAATAIHSEGDSRRLADVVLQAGRLIGLLTLGIAGFVIAANPLILTFWLGTTYPQVWAITALLVAAFGVSNLIQAGATVLSAMGKPRYETEYAVLGAVVNIAATVALGLTFGLYGILAGSLIGAVVSTAYFIWRSHRILQLSVWEYLFDWLWRVTTATLVAALSVYAAWSALPASVTSSRGAAAVGLAALGALYLGLLLAGLRWVRFLNERDLQLVRRVLPVRLQRYVSLRAVEFFFGVRR
jgi:O-antigen/teichoic acid export membrane protein